MLYSANLSNSQKALKVLDSIKDSYITMILVMVCLKIYLMAYRMVNEMGVSAFTKAMMLLFIAFSVIDGPNIIQKLTGVDAGLSSGMGKIIAGLQASRMASQILSHGHYAASRLSAGDGIQDRLLGLAAPGQETQEKDLLLKPMRLAGRKGRPERGKTARRTLRTSGRNRMLASRITRKTARQI
ncbi:MAG: hypothetical protein ACLR71_18740 [[Clostridium] scindens]